MDKQTLEVLEYNKIIERLSSLAITPYGRSLCSSVMPYTVLDDIENALNDTFEMQEIIKVCGVLPLADICDVRPSLKKLSKENAYLLPHEFLELKSTISAIHHTKDFFMSAPKKYPGISLKISKLDRYYELLKAVATTFDDNGSIKDSASAELLRIRKEMSETKHKIRKILNDLLIRQDTKQAFQDDFVTIRDDRFCLALKADFKGKIKGIIHSESGSGETYFIEPFETVELNNLLTMLLTEERDEEIKILKKLSAAVIQKMALLLKDILILAETDVILAKARLGITLNSVKPEITNRGAAFIKNACHPILALSGKAVPITLHLRQNKKVFVISGANTGGKTVALKTIGILTLMTQAGFTIPASDGSTVNVFDNIIADIGDRQDIQMNLSTFSAHLKRLGEILSIAGENTLVLIDEMCGGTDPTEAGALSLAILERLKSAGAATVVTTHLNTLKSFAYINEFAENISVEFDEETLKPTYKLLYGIPGRSCAVTIAEKWGIDKDIINKAKEYLKGTEGAGIEFIKTIAQEKKLLTEERLRMEGLNIETIQINDRRKEAVRRFDAERHKLLERERKKAEEIIKEAEQKLKKIIEEAKTQGLKDLMEQRKALAEIRAKTLEAIQIKKEKPSYVPEVGDIVNIVGQRNRGRVISVSKKVKELELLIGSLKVKVSFDNIEFVKKSRDEKADNQVYSTCSYESSTLSSDFSREINIIGLTADDAISKVDKFIDTAILNNTASVVIIHGAGTGRLRNAVHEYLKNHKAVKGFKYAEQKQGGSGATLVEL